MHRPRRRRSRSRCSPAQAKRLNRSVRERPVAALTKATEAGSASTSAGSSRGSSASRYATDDLSACVTRETEAQRGTHVAFGTGTSTEPLAPARSRSTDRATTKPAGACAASASHHRGHTAIAPEAPGTQPAPGPSRCRAQVHELVTLRDRTRTPAGRSRYAAASAAARAAGRQTSAAGWRSRRSAAARRAEPLRSRVTSTHRTNGCMRPTGVLGESPRHCAEPRGCGGGGVRLYRHQEPRHAPAGGGAGRAPESAKHGEDAFTPMDLQET